MKKIASSGINIIYRILRNVQSALLSAYPGVIQSLLRDRKIFYGEFFGSDSRVLTFFKNIIEPENLVAKVNYGQVHFVPDLFGKARNTGRIEMNSEEEEIFGQFNRDGVVILPGRFKELADYFCKKYKVGPQYSKPSEEYTTNYMNPVDPRVLSMCVDETILKVFAKYYGCQPYLRGLPAHNIAYPSIDSKTALGLPRKYGFGVKWHFDTVNQVQIHMLLTDVEKDGTRMLFAKRNHRRMRVHVDPIDNHYSEEYVQKHYEIVDCCGPAGTAYIFDTNGLHRADAVPDRFRSTIEVLFTPGNSIIPGKLQNPVDIPENLSSLQKEAFRYIL